MPFQLGDRHATGFTTLVEMLRRNGKESEARINLGRDARDVLVRKALVVSGEIESRVMPTGHGAAENILVFVDITERKSNEARIRHLAHHDPLTGACNRLAFPEELAAATKKAGPGRPVSLVAIDLDRFKPVNDVYGHAVGDELLRQIVGRLSCALKPGMRLFRMGGDEFALLCPPGVEHDPVSFAEGLMEMISSPFEIDGHIILIGASAGVSALQSDTESPDSLTRYADLALYQAKRGGGGAAIAFDHTTLSSGDDRRRLELELVDAVETGAFSLVYQPVFGLDRERIVAVEALARWRRPRSGEVVPPETFIAQAENSGFIERIDRHILERAMEQLAQWSARGAGIDTMLINMSVRTLTDEGIVEHLADLLQRSRVSPRSIVIELTESFAVRNTDAVLKTMTAINELGIRFAIDDFGTGYTSLRLVSRLPIAFIKLDKTFVRDVSCASRPNVRHVVGAIADLSRNMGVDMIAEGVETEGVETEAEFDALVALDCRYFQGNLLAEPLTPDRLKVRVESREGRRSVLN
jgi:diguanylate cyclase (GGDEF)-like protein